MTEISKFPYRPGWRDEVWENLNRRWDLIIIGGGITGVGIMALASRIGLKTLLIDQSDFSSGTSSRSSKLVHGGLRYLKQLNIGLTRESVQQREYLSKRIPGLVKKMEFIYPVYKGYVMPAWMVEIGFIIYTHLSKHAGKYHRLSPDDLLSIVPNLTSKDLKCGFQYFDASTDDSRLVLRILFDALNSAQKPAYAINYARVTNLLIRRAKIRGVVVEDTISQMTKEIEGHIVINATGAWADQIRRELELSPKLRLLKGSHLFFKQEKFPLSVAVSFQHQDDDRLMFAYPWEGVTLVGTTDLDHRASMAEEPAISTEEFDYIMRAVQYHFPKLDLKDSDVISTQAGVRAVLNTRKQNPSDENREHIILNDKGLLTVTGGKLTTFRKIAYDALKMAHSISNKIPIPSPEIQIVIDHSKYSKSKHEQLQNSILERLMGRYNLAYLELLKCEEKLLSNIPETPYLLAEIKWSARNEAVMHLDDLLFRRFRFGILLSDGGKSLLVDLKSVIQSELEWDDKKWDYEVDRYMKLRHVAHGIPSHA